MAQVSVGGGGSLHPGICPEPLLQKPPGRGLGSGGMSSQGGKHMHTEAAEAAVPR